MPAAKPKTPAPRVLWKGAISFGLVHVPVALHSATVDHAIDFDWLDKRSMDPVGYKRINKKTGKEIAREQIVKGVEIEDGEYVVLSDQEIADAYPRTTQTIEIQTFVPADSIPFVYLERPYYLSPINRGGKVYALLREPLPADNAKQAGITPRELEMASQLVEDMSSDWDAEAFKDSFKDEILRLVERKAEAGKTESVAKLGPMEEAEAARPGAKVIDLTELLKRSLRKGGKDADTPGDDAPPRARKPAASRAARKRAPASKAATRRKAA